MLPWAGCWEWGHREETPALGAHVGKGSRWVGTAEPETGPQGQQPPSPTPHALRLSGPLPGRTCHSISPRSPHSQKQPPLGRATGGSPGPPRLPVLLLQGPSDKCPVQRSAHCFPSVFSQLGLCTPRKSGWDGGSSRLTVPRPPPGQAPELARHMFVA